MFTIRIYLPYSKKTVSIKQFSNLDYKNLLKTLANKNYTQCNYFIDKLIHDCSFGELTDINFIDKFVTLLNLRCISIGDTLTQSIQKENTKYNLNYSIYSIIDKIVNNAQLSFTDTIQYESLQVTTGIPKQIFINPQDIHNFIYSIKIGTKIFNLNDLSESEKIEAVNILPGQIMVKLYQNIYLFKHQIQDFDILTLKVNIETKEELPVKLYLDQDNMHTLVSVFFNEHLTNIFLKQFILSKQHNIDCNYYDSIPPVESEIFYNFHKELQEHEKQQNESSKGVSMGAMPTTEF